MSAASFDAELAALLEEITPDVVEHHERSGAHPGKLLARVLGTGLAGCVLDPAGPPGGRWRFAAAVAAIAERWTALAESVHLQVLATCGLAEHGTAGQRERYLDGLRSGTLVAANCLNEREAGSDLAAMTTAATRTADGYEISGVKEWIGHAPVADVFNVYAKTSGGGLGGITCFLLDAGAPGLTVRERAKVAGLGGLPAGDVHLDRVRVGPEAVLGRAGRGIRVAHPLFTQGRIGIAGCALGLGRAALRRAVAHASAHHQFGRPILEFQGIAFPIAEASTELAAARALVRVAAEAVEHGGGDAELLAAQAKLKATTAASQAAAVAVRVLGSRAYDEDEPALRWAGEARLLELLQGTNEIQKIAISSRLKFLG
ncbi:acyl-CoA dehydrogenase family protein [Dactylosporangium matsuzakiense]|uniref:acyl-CoA dehydrogenase family protein n=1 Tax=Dactylosporangium matsuzakiense TaxID=53360 RepID=UPI0021C2D4CB|nr:acyl-CoA dehydrogenase [Dactylosporangium matsuzakiense]UWZ48546.1 acyl-CoA dehydrogenase [Dactylosporangium matsuzakiense]